MTTITTSLVTGTLRLLEEKVPSGAEAERLARLVETRAEFLAHLLLRRKTFATHPRILAALERAANSGAPAGPTTRRRIQSDAAQQRAARQDLDTALRAILGEVVRLQADSETADSAISRFLRQSALTQNETTTEMKGPLIASPLKPTAEE
jgi:hypothetical protein